ncbi:hypothetical protein AMECASPLE_021192 [Ameca splendens]|uniref:Uncharacterized protein n=1 Tax=Ameca splendens TaxID=208324 RepID=A0ABV1AAA9_9TELE
MPYVCMGSHMTFCPTEARNSSLRWCWRFSGALGDSCDLSADCMEEYLSGRLPALQCQSVALVVSNLRLCLPC